MEKIIIDKQQKPQEKIDKKTELIKKSHEQALAAYRLESMISEAFIDTTSEDIVECLQNLPEDVRKTFLTIIQNYAEQREQTRAKMRVLSSYLETVKRMGVPAEKTPEYFGQMMFRQRTDKEPKGKITFEQREAYFIMICEDPDDYAQAAAGKKGDSDAPYARMSGGTFHRSMELAFGGPDLKQTVSVLLIKGYKDEKDKNSVIVHERQHFINDRLLDTFRITEKHAKESGAEWKGRNIKDEVLAYIRDGSSGSKIANSLFGELYSHLFFDMSKEEQLKVKETINKIKDLLDNNRWYLESPESRGVLVYQLAGIPLERIPVWLDAALTFYAKRKELMDLFPNLFDKYSGGDHPVDWMIEDVFPSGDKREQTMDSIEELWLQMREMRDVADKIIFDIGMSKEEAKETLEGKVVTDYIRLCKQLNYQVGKLKRAGAVMPHVGPSDLYYYGGLWEEGELGETAFSKQIKQVVADAVKDFPQTQVDAIAEYLNQKDKPKPTGIRKLEKTIKDAVHAKNGSQKCTVQFESDPIYMESFRVFVNFAVNKEDKQENIKEASFQLHFHSSKFVPFEALPSEIAGEELVISEKEEAVLASKLFQREAKRKVHHVFGEAETKATAEHRAYFFYPPMYYIERGFINKDLVMRMEKGGRLLTVGTGKGDLEKMLWKGFGVNPKQIIQSDIELFSTTQDLPFEKKEFDFLGAWPTFDEKFDYILFPESFGVGFSQVKFADGRSHRFFETLDRATDKVLKRESVPDREISLFKQIIEMDRPSLVKKCDVLLTALENLNDNGEVRLDSHSLDEQAIAFIVLKLREKYPKLEFDWKWGHLVLKKISS